MATRLSYVVITPARNEAENLPRLAAALRSQRHLPSLWVIVENGSTDETAAICQDLAASTPWIKVLRTGGSSEPVRGAPIVRAIHAALEMVDPEIDLVVNVDADVSMEDSYFMRLADAFASDRSLGIASGSAYEEENGAWEQRFVTGGTVWGATRAYRRACLDDVLPLEERHGWDGLDQLAARAKGWSTRILLDLPFRHHRPEGARDGSRWAHWRASGDTAYYMGYRPWYLVLRAAHQTRSDGAALGMLAGYASAAIRRAPRWQNAAGRQVLRDDQSLRMLGRRRREALGVDLETRDRTSRDPEPPLVQE